MSDATTGTTGGTPAAGSAPAPSPSTAPSAPASAPASAAWYSSFNDPSLASHGSVRKFASPEAMAKSYTELERSAVFLQKDNPEAMGKLWNKLGRPETPEGYGLTAPQLQGGEKFDVTPWTGFTKFAHETGLTKAQAQAVVNWVGPRVAQQLSGKRVDPAKSEKTMRAEWGASYDHNITLVQRGVAHLGGEPLAKALKDTGAANHPDVLRFLAKVGAVLAEDNLIPATTPSQTSGRAEYDALWNDPKSPYWDRNHPGHKKAVARIEELAPLVHRSK